MVGVPSIPVFRTQGSGKSPPIVMIGDACSLNPNSFHLEVRLLGPDTVLQVVRSFWERAWKAASANSPSPSS
jgi:hypothetical protein